MTAHKIWLIIRLPLIIAFIFYAAILLYFFIYQSRFIYFPDNEIVGTPLGVGLQYETVSFETEDKVKLSGWFIPAENQKGVILFCHGNAGNMSHRLESIQIFNSLGLSVLIFDYRGYGKSNGKPSEQGTYLDAKAAYNFLVNKMNVSPDNIIAFGRSLGGAIAAWLARENKVKALIVESAFSSIPDMAAQLYPFIPVRLLSRFNYNTRQYLQKVNCPVLIIHSLDDELIPFSHSKELFEASNEPKQFLEISGPHGNGFLISQDKYKKWLEAFVT